MNEQRPLAIALLEQKLERLLRRGGRFLYASDVQVIDNLSVWIMLLGLLHGHSSPLGIRRLGISWRDKGQGYEKREQNSDTCADPRKIGEDKQRRHLPQKKLRLVYV